ncbi:MAG: hypothetical protein WCC84_09185 [Candidatus Cybelea sp.]
MKQIVLKTRNDLSLKSGFCPARAAIVWSLYGWVVAAFWRSAGSNPCAQASVWALALLAALALLIPMVEV